MQETMEKKIRDLYTERSMNAILKDESLGGVITPELEMQLEEQLDIEVTNFIKL